MFFHASAFAGSLGSCLNTRPSGRVLKHLLRDLRQVLMHWNKHVWLLFLQILPYFNQIRTKVLLKHSNIPDLTVDFSKQNGVGCKLWIVITSSQWQSLVQRFRKQKHRWNDQSGPQCFLYKHHVNNSRLILTFFKFKPMSNSTWIFLHLTMG